MSTVVAVLGLALSVVAIVVAVRAARSARDQALISADALHDQRTPDLLLEVETVAFGHPSRLYTLLRGPQDLDSVRIEVMFPGDETVPVPSLGMGTLADTRTADLGPIRVGERPWLRAGLGPADARNPARFRLTSTYGTETWVTYAEVEVDRSDPNVW